MFLTPADSIEVRTILPGGGSSEVGEVVVHSISYDEGDNRLALDDLLEHAAIENGTSGIVSMALDRKIEGFGTLRCAFIGDLQGRAFIMRRDDRESGTTMFRVGLSYGVL